MWLDTFRMEAGMAFAAGSPNAQAKIANITEPPRVKRLRVTRRKRRAHGRSRPAPRRWKLVVR